MLYLTGNQLGCFAAMGNVVYSNFLNCFVFEKRLVRDHQISDAAG